MSLVKVAAGDPWHCDAVTSPRSERWPENAGALTFVLATIPGAGIAVAAATIGASGEHGAVHAFVHSPQYRFWVFLLAAQVTLWLICLVDLWRTTRGVCSASPAWRRRDVYAVFAAFILPLWASVVTIPLASGLRYPLPHHQTRVLLLTALGAAVATVGGWGLGRIHAQLGDLLRHPAAGVDAIARYLDLRRALQRILLVEGSMIGAAVLASGGLRNAVQAYLGSSPAARTHASPFPREYVLIYGVYYSALLAVVYVPTYTRLNAAGAAIRDAAFPRCDVSSAGWKDCCDARARMDDQLQLGLSSATSFRAGVAILTPLVGSLVGLLIGTGST